MHCEACIVLMPAGARPKARATAMQGRLPTEHGFLVSKRPARCGNKLLPASQKPSLQPRCGYVLTLFLPTIPLLFGRELQEGTRTRR